MSNLKYKSTNSTSSTTNVNLPIWCSLSTPSQIARKYASIAPIWCHISRPRQLKKKFASTLHQAQNLLSRQNSKDTSVAESNEMDEAVNLNNKFKSPGIPSSSSKNKINSSSSDLAGKLATNDYEISSANQAIGELLESQRQIIKKRDNSLDIKRKTDNIIPTSNSYLYNNSTSNAPNPSPIAPSSQSYSRWTSNKGYKPNYTLDSSLSNSNAVSGSLQEEASTENQVRRPLKYTSNALKYSDKSGGSKTEKIISKSSKSSPNLLSKERDYDHLYTDRYENLK